MESKTKRGRPRKYGEKAVQRSPADSDRSGVPLHTNIDPRISAAVEAYCEQTIPRVTKTTLVETGLILALTKAGFWPYPKKA